MPHSGKRYKRKKKSRFHFSRLLRKIRRFFVGLIRWAARGIYYGIQDASAFIAGLPPKTRLIGGGACGFLLVLIVVLAIAIPKKKPAANSPEAAMTASSVFAEGTGAAANAYTGGEGAAVLDTASGETPVEEGTIASADASIEGEPETIAASGFTGELREGTDGEIVTTLQVRLMELGYMDSDEPTQHFGPLTKSALATFQRHNGLDDDGICGESTYAALMSEEAKVYVMQKGDSGDDVEDVQNRLYELGYLDNSANITATFGDKTEVAAMAFQKKNDLKADGKVGNKTINKLYDEDVVGNAFTLGDEAPIIKECQTVLKKLGYITFKPDGTMGKTTVSAIKNFQRANGLTVDGALGPKTRDLLLSGDAQAMVLQLGDYSSDVKSMQKYLVKLNYLKSANATGYFGAITEDAVKAFQKRNSLTADGKVGAVTLSIMKSTKAKKSATKPSSSSESSSGSSGSSGSSSSGSSSGSSGSSASVSNKTGVEKLVALAASKVGCKYVRGAKGPNTFDCSGFVYWCMKNAGISCSYQTSIMWRTCSKYTRISSMGSLARGDILVFSGSTDSAGHVGIYLGGGKMIDASSSEGQVRQSSSVLKSGGYWTTHFIVGYRVF